MLIMDVFISVCNSLSLIAFGGSFLTEMISSNINLLIVSFTKLVVLS
jgi:hypothetical protein